MSEEAGGSVGQLLPIPDDPGDNDDDTDPHTALKSGLRAGKSRTLLVETTAAGFGEGPAAAPRQDWMPRRFGADPPATLATLRTDAALAVLTACGVPVSLATDRDGTSEREGWRRFIMRSVEPLLNKIVRAIVRAELAFDLSGLWAHDGQGRASMFQKLVAGGVAVNEALRTSGLLADE